MAEPVSASCLRVPAGQTFDPDEGVDLLQSIVGLLFTTGLAMNSVQQAMESDYGKARAGDAVAALDEAIRFLGMLTLALSFEVTEALDHSQSRSFNVVA